MLTRAIKREEVTKQGFCKILWRNLLRWGSLLLVLIQFQFQSQYQWLGWGWALIWVWLGGGGGGRIFEAGRLLTFSPFRMGAYSRWALIRSWALIRINTVFYFSSLGVSTVACNGTPTKLHSTAARKVNLGRLCLKLIFLKIILLQATLS